MKQADYLGSLDLKAKPRYISKLSTLGLKEMDDPYAVSNNRKYVDDMTSWPPIEYGHIFCFSLHSARVDEMEKLRGV